MNCEASRRSNSLRVTASESAFTLAEAVAALTFMAILIPVALEGLNLASRAGEVAARKSEAALVAETVLNDAIINTNVSLTTQSGQTRQGVHDFQWTVTSEPWNQDAYIPNMRLLSATVTYTAQGQKYSVRISTLQDGSPVALQPITSQ